MTYIVYGYTHDALMCNELRDIDLGVISTIRQCRSLLRVRFRRADRFKRHIDRITLPNLLSHMLHKAAPSLSRRRHGVLDPLGWLAA
jgi:hypothetical protein